MKLSSILFAAVTLQAVTGVLAQATNTCGLTTWQLTAGQTIPAGTVKVCNDLNNIYITYTLDTVTYPDAKFGSLHAWVGNDLTLVPATPGGIPIPGQFPYKYDATGLTAYTFTIPFSSVNIVDAQAGCGTSLYVVTHAEVDLNGSAPGGTETAFGGPTPGSGPRWWFYGSYKICCDFGPPPVRYKETAYAKCQSGNTWVWTTNNRSNPEKLPSLNLTQNRWGWAINLSAPGTLTCDIWAGAGLNNTANGIKAGMLTINWNGTTAIVTYSMFPGFLLHEVHLYAGDTSPTTIAPGQYGYLDQFGTTGVATYTFTVPLADTNGTGGVWIVAHAVVSRP